MIRELYKINSISSLITSNRKYRYLKITINIDIFNYFISNNLIIKL